MEKTPSIKNVYETYSNGRYGYSHYIGTRRYFDSVSIRYKIGLDTEYLNARERVKDEIREEHGIPSNVMYNGEKCSFNLEVFSLQENHHNTHQMAKVYSGGGYQDEYDFCAFLAHDAFEQSDSWNWYPSADTGACLRCGLSTTTRVPSGGTVQPAGVSHNEADAEDLLCVPCGLKEIGREDVIEKLSVGHFKRTCFTESFRSFEQIPNALWGMKGDLKETLNSNTPDWFYSAPKYDEWQARNAQLNRVKKHASSNPFGYGVAVFRFTLSYTELPEIRGQRIRGKDKYAVRAKPAPDHLVERVRDWCDGRDEPDALYCAVEVGPRGGVRDITVHAAYKYK